MTMDVSPPIQSAHQVLDLLFRDYPPADLVVRFWDGSEWRPSHASSPQFTIVLKHAGSLRAMLWPPEPLSMAEAYIYDDFDVEGDMLAFSEMCRYLSTSKFLYSQIERLKLAAALAELPRENRKRRGQMPADLSGDVHSKSRDQQAIRYHYDLSNECFALILDSHLQYTSGFYDSPEEDLETAQVRKLHTICRKLNLKPGSRLLDIGCGWGGLAVFAAQHYGAEVVGVTLSESQAAWARASISRSGLESLCRIFVTDYRDYIADKPFDAVSTIEVSEHFGASQFPTYYAKCREFLKPGGLVMLQQIATSGRSPEKPEYRAAMDFTQKYVFPDGELLSVGFAVAEAEKAGFETLDVEAYREHYVYTLRDWLHNLERNREAIIRETNETAYRVFRIYIAGACRGFVHSDYSLYQSLFRVMTSER